MQSAIVELNTSADRAIGSPRITHQNRSRDRAGTVFVWQELGIA
jgi:hypothetical protein